MSGHPRDNWSWIQCWDVVSSGGRREEGGAKDATFFVEVGVGGVVGLVFERGDGLSVGWVGVS
jgi:hypothetical protein